jgi:hypothetical protein
LDAAAEASLRVHDRGWVAASQPAYEEPGKETQDEGWQMGTRLTWITGATCDGRVS